MKTLTHYPKHPVLLNENNLVLRFLGLLKLAILIFLLMMTTVLVSQAGSFHKLSSIQYNKPLVQLETYLYKNKLFLNWSMETKKGVEYRNLIYVLEGEPPLVKIEYQSGREGVLNFLGIMEKAQIVKEYNFSIWESDVLSKSEMSAITMTEKEKKGIVLFFRITILDADKTEINSVTIPLPINGEGSIANLSEMKPDKEIADIWYSEGK